jgi:hypothetical protein
LGGRRPFAWDLGCTEEVRFPGVAPADGLSGGMVVLYSMKGDPSPTPLDSCGAERRGGRGRAKRGGPINDRRWWGEDNTHLSFPLGYKLSYFSSLLTLGSSAVGFTKLWAQHLYQVVVSFCIVPAGIGLFSLFILFLLYS